MLLPLARFLGVTIHEGVSYPVGKVDLLDLYPLNFREFSVCDGGTGPGGCPCDEGLCA